MADVPDSPTTLAERFAVLSPRMRVETVAVTPALYEVLDSRFDGFRSHALVALYAFDADWNNWERHPHGDEIVILLSGAAEMILRRKDGDDRIRLEVPEQYVVIPRNTWHTARVLAPARMLFITPGEGTEHAASPPL